MKTKHGIMIVVAIVILAVAAAGTWYWYIYDQSSESSKQNVVLHGNVEIREVDLAFEVQGRVDAVDTEEGDRVEKGQLVARLDDEPFEYELATVNARIESQAQMVAELKAGTRPQNIRKAEADVQAAEARLVEARRTRDRVASLVPSGASTQQKLDDANAALQTATAELGAATAALDLARAGPRNEDILAAEARLAEFKSQRDLAQWRVTKTKLLAPSNGVIRQRILEPGDMASPDRPISTLALVDPVWVRAYLSETDLGAVKPGMTAWITTDSYPEKRYEGWVGFISPTAEFTPKYVQTEELRTKLVYEVRVYAQNPDGELRLGMPATVQIPLAEGTKSSGEKRSLPSKDTSEPAPVQRESTSS